DEFGNELPDGIASVFTEVHRLSELKRQIETIRRDVAEMCETRDPLFAFLRLQQFEAEMKNAAACVRFAIPYCLCPKCGGDKCKACEMQGWVPKEYYEQTMPKELLWKKKTT